MFRYLRSDSGSTLLVVICLFVLIGALVIAGTTIIGPQVKRGKINDTKTKLNSAVDAVISWSVANGRIPKNTEFQTILPDPDDAWGKPLLYLYAGTLADTAAAGYGGLCGVTSTTTYNGQQLAFVLVSGGDDFTIESTPNPSQAFAGAPTLQSSDIYRLVTLGELQSRAGCPGTTKGRLRIVNNEIPNGCSGKYKVTLYADGGVPTNYSWQLVSATPTTPPPPWTPAPQPQTGAFAVFSSSTTPLGSSNKITIQLIDGQATVQRTYNLKTTSCGCAGYRVFSNTGITNDFMLGSCRNNIGSSSEITNGTFEFIAGSTIIRRDSAGNCNKTIRDSITYAQVVSADVNGDCQVNYGPGGVVTDR